MIVSSSYDFNAIRSGGATPEPEITAQKNPTMKRKGTVKGKKPKSFFSQGSEALIQVVNREANAVSFGSGRIAQTGFKLLEGTAQRKIGKYNKSKAGFSGFAGADCMDTVYSNGDKGDCVKQWQNVLLSMGYSLPKYGADGDFGTETVAAVKQMQAYYGLQQTGAVGPILWGEINRRSGEASTAVSLNNFPTDVSAVPEITEAIKPGEEITPDQKQINVQTPKTSTDFFDNMLNYINKGVDVVTKVATIKTIGKITPEQQALANATATATAKQRAANNMNAAAGMPKPGGKPPTTGGIGDVMPYMMIGGALIGTVFLIKYLRQQQTA